MNIKTSLLKGFEWLTSTQNINGSFGTNPKTTLHTTSLSLLALELYAIKNSISPLDDSYKYKMNVEKALEYLLLNAKLTLRGVCFKDEDYSNCVTGLALSAICANKSPYKTIDLDSSVVNKKTYKEVANLIVRYLTWSQDDNGGWACKSGKSPDNMTSGYVSLGLNLAQNTDLGYNCTIDLSLKKKLYDWINFIQNINGGSGYCDCNTFINTSNTGNLISEMFLCEEDLSSLKLCNALRYIANNWLNDTDYQSIFLITQGLSIYNINHITNTSNNNINWIEDISKILISQQNQNGYWPYNSLDDPHLSIISTSWALLSLVNFIDCSYIHKTSSKIPFNNYIKVCENEVDCLCDICKSIEIEGEVKVFAHKYSNNERDCIPDLIPGNGDDIGFTLVFGNYGSINYKCNCNKPTVQDCLFINGPANLRLISLCIPDCFRLYDLNNYNVIEEGYFFEGDNLYNIQVQKFENCIWNSCFDLPCHSMYCISMLLQVEFCCHS